jgi:regulator of sigma E protease
MVNNETPVMSYRVPVVVLKTVTGENAAAAGMEAGDRIVSVNGVATPSLSEFYPALNSHKGKTVEMQVERGGKLVSLDCAINDAGKIGIQLTPPTDLFKIEEVQYNFFTAIPKGIELGTDRLVTYVSSLKLLFTKEGAQSVGGFGAIGDMYPDQWNWYSFWNITAFLSVILAFMNILPIPALDGGHVVFTLWEIVTRRKPSLKVLENAQMVGMALLFLLLIYANANDIYRFFFK